MGSQDNTIIFGLRDRKTLLSEPSRAFLRHAYNQFYHDFSNVDLKAGALTPEATLSYALKSFRSAVLRHGMHFRILHNSRFYSTLPAIAPREARERYPQLISIDESGSFVLAPALTQAVDQAEVAATRAISQQQNRLHPFPRQH